MKYVSDTFCSLFAISVNKSYERVIILYVSLRLKEIDYDAADATTRRTTKQQCRRRQRRGHAPTRTAATRSRRVSVTP